MEFILGSGAKLLVTPASYSDASALKNVMLRALKGKLESVSKVDIEDRTAQGAAIMGLILEATTDQAFEEALFKCGEKAAYSFNGANAQQKVGPGLFDGKDGETARGDLLEIELRIVEVNVLPFFRGMFSRLKEVIPTIIADLVSKSDSQRTS